MLEFRIDRCLSRHQVRQDMPIHEGEKVFKIDSEDGPWVSKGQTGESQVEKRIKSRVCWRRRMHVVNGMFQVDEGAACSRGC